jgi:competence protein ComFB
MSEQNIDYHKHIEQAIQNVLSKVKKMPLPPNEARPASSDIAKNTETENSPNHSSSTEPPVYLEADDLYTPVPLEENHSSEELAEAPLIADSYSAPFNIFEEFVETELNIMLSRYIDLCRCSQCRADIVALALHQLPAYYVTGTRGTLTAKSIIWTRYTQQITDAVIKAIHIVYKRPRSNCQKIRQIIWLKPEIEDVSQQHKVETTNDVMFFDQQTKEEQDLELSFSSEVAEIIQLIEQGEDENLKADLLPVSSPYVHQNTAKDSSDTLEKATDEPTLELIEDWDAL